MSSIIITNGLGGTGLEKAASLLEDEKSPLDAIEQGLLIAESDVSIPYVGIGAQPNILGQLELDAAIMDGDTLEVGAVGALKGYLGAISLARQVMDILPHVILVGEGAALFAAERGSEKLPENPTAVLEEYKSFLEERIPAERLTDFPNIALSDYIWPNPDKKSKKDTVIYLAQNVAGQMAGGTSTSGWGYKYPGRLGDSPIIGAGLYVDSRYGACACTHTGEMTIRLSTARSVVQYMKKSASLKDAVHEAIEDLRSLRTGYLGPVVIHAIDSSGEPYVASTSHTGAKCHVWTESSPEPMVLTPVVDEVTHHC